MIYSDQTENSYIDKPCIYKNTCGFEYCNMIDCPYYKPKTKGRKWAEKENKNDRSDLQRQAKADAS